MKKALIKLCFLSLAITSCTQHPTAYEKEQAAIKKENLANKVIKKVAKQIKQETGLCPMGTMGQMLNEIQKLGLSFYYNHPVDIAEGRKLLITAGNTLLQEINQEKQIQPYLSRHPFGPWNIQIEIFLHTSDGKSVPQGSLHVIEVVDGILRYQIDDPKNYGFFTIYEETYEEAIARIKDPSLPLVSYKPNPLNNRNEDKVKQGICFIGNDGEVWKFDENGNWVKSK